jgi:hypothetical protein
LKIDVRCPEDVSAAFTFSEKINVPLVIKNTGVRFHLRDLGTKLMTVLPEQHDYKGRSSAPHSLALWVCPYIFRQLPSSNTSFSRADA